MSRWVQRAAIVVIGLGVLGAGAAWYLKGRNGQVMAYRTAPVKRGDRVPVRIFSCAAANCAIRSRRISPFRMTLE